MEHLQTFGKTAKGEAEVRTREHRLAHGLRYLLIMIDGKSTIAQLRDKCGTLTDVATSLKALEQQGFVAIFGGSNPVISGPADVIKLELIAVAREMLGEKAQGVEKKIRESTSGIEGLTELAIKCQKLIKLTIDEGSAERFLQRCNAVIAARLSP